MIIFKRICFLTIRICISMSALLLYKNHICDFVFAQTTQPSEAFSVPVIKGKMFLASQEGQVKKKSSSDESIHLCPGPHLFLDDFLIERSENVTRKVNQPQRDSEVPNPIVSGAKGMGDDCFQPYMTILRDPQTKRFRIWYGARTEDFNMERSHLAYMESDDGIHWIRPHRVLETPEFRFGASIIDEGVDFPDYASRFKFGSHNDGGLNVAQSADGYIWKPIIPGTVLHHSHDINNIFRDPVRNRYIVMVNAFITGDRASGGSWSWTGGRRVTMQSVSSDLIHWDTPRLVVTPDDSLDKGETQFYGLSALTVRGNLLIGIVKVLRDDLPTDQGEPVKGVGYSCLAWSHDGEYWCRDSEPFFNRNPEKGTWDHAMAWIDCQLPVNNDVFLYYGGYKNGHKVNRFEERQIGLVRIKRDRYVAREALGDEGILQTRVCIINGESITLNVESQNGSVRVQIVEPDGKQIQGFSFADCKPIIENSLASPVKWKKSLSEIKGKPVRLVFSLKNARLYAFNLQ